MPGCRAASRQTAECAGGCSWYGLFVVVIAGAIFAFFRLGQLRIRKKEEAVFFREGFAALDQLDEVALLGVGEFVMGGIVGAGHGIKAVLKTF